MAERLSGITDVVTSTLQIITGELHKGNSIQTMHIFNLSRYVLFQLYSIKVRVFTGDYAKIRTSGEIINFILVEFDDILNIDNHEMYFKFNIFNFTSYLFFFCKIIYYMPEVVVRKSKHQWTKSKWNTHTIRPHNLILLVQ